jgi:hypothetical protein
MTRIAEAAAAMPSTEIAHAMPVAPGTKFARAKAAARSASDSPHERAERAARPTRSASAAWARASKPANRLFQVNSTGSSSQRKPSIQVRFASWIASSSAMGDGSKVIHWPSATRTSTHACAPDSRNT